MNCNCSICNGRDYNVEGIKLADREIIPFVKREILRLRFPDRPFPPKYQSITASLFCYSQALAYNRAHNIKGTYYTDNKWMLKIGHKLAVQFGMPVDHKDNLPKIYDEACEFNILTKDK